MSPLPKYLPKSLKISFTKLHFTHYFCLATDGLFISHEDQFTYSPGDSYHKIVVSHNTAVGLLFHLYNNHNTHSIPFTVTTQTNLQQLILYM